MLDCPRNADELRRSLGGLCALCGEGFFFAAENAEDAQGRESSSCAGTRSL
jgi:hypothetical protein